MNTNIYQRRVPIKASDKVKPIFDSQQIDEGTTTLDFFPSDANKRIYRSNYVSNSLPGTEDRRIIGLNFSLNKIFIRDDSANSIDALAIMNALKDASVELKADNDNKEFLATTLDRHFNFEETKVHNPVANALVDGALETETRKVVQVKPPEMIKLKEPFDLASNQVITLTVNFNSGADFPSEAEWTASGQSFLYLFANLYLAEIAN